MMRRAAQTWLLLLRAQCPLVHSGSAYCGNNADALGSALSSPVCSDGTGVEAGSLLPPGTELREAVRSALRRSVVRARATRRAGVEV